jgi:hypothetical protein
MEAESLIVPAAVVAIVLAPILALIALASRPSRGGLVLLALAAAVCACWLLFVQLVANDYRDADGFVDCWPHCTAWQESVSWVLFLGPIVACVLAGLALVTILRGRGFSRSRNAQETVLVPASRRPRLRRR